MIKNTQFFSAIKRGLTTSTQGKFRRVGVQFTKMEFFPGKYVHFAEQIPQIAREIDRFPSVLRGGVYYVAMNMGTRPGHHTEGLSLSIFDSVEAAEEALAFKPETYKNLRSIMKAPPHRYIYQGVILKEGKQSDSDACFATTYIQAKAGAKEDCLRYLQDRFPGLGPHVEWVSAMTSPDEEETAVMVIAAFPSYDSYRKSRAYEAPFLEYLAPFSHGLPILEFHEKGAFHIHSESKSN
eukprot:c5519_g1_i1.p1 GENE.c5519_g1_i1~~c5519_g1_i1.p1  ORF type:complete len:238 (+),score=71.10 c5519_g1_i1:85-798(+)